MPSPQSAIQNPKSEIAPRTIFNAVLRCKGDLDAVANELNIDAWSIAEWAMRPEIDDRLAALSTLHRFTIRRQLANALPETIDKLREHARSSNEVISCKACCALTRLAQSPEGRQRPSPGTHAPESSTTSQHAPGRIKPVPNPVDDYHTPTPNHSPQGGVGNALRVAGGGFSSTNSSTPEPTDAHASPPLDASCLDASVPSSPDASMPSPHPCPSVSSVATPTSPSAADPHSPQSAIQNPQSKIPPIAPPTFGLTQAQLNEYGPREKKHLISVPLPEGGYTTFDSKRPFAGFSGDAIDFMRADAHLTCALPLDENTLYLLTRFIRPTPQCPVPDFPIPDLDDSDPFPALDPEWFPAPIPGIALPDNLKDLADLRLTPDISLTIARNKNPWLCLPLTGKGKPDRKRISTDTTARYAFRKVARALFDARNLARSAWNERWQRTELWRLITLYHEGRLPPLAPGPTPAGEDPSADPPSDSS